MGSTEEELAKIAEHKEDSYQDPIFKKGQYGFWRQTKGMDGDSIDFDYTEEYREAQSTNTEMAHLRLGWILNSIPAVDLKTYVAVDVGAGTLSDITIDVEDGSDNCLVSAGGINTINNFTSACDCVLVIIKMGDSDIKCICAHGYRVMTI